MSQIFKIKIFLFMCGDTFLCLFVIKGPIFFSPLKHDNCLLRVLIIIVTLKINVFIYKTISKQRKKKLTLNKRAKF